MIAITALFIHRVAAESDGSVVCVCLCVCACVCVRACVWLRCQQLISLTHAGLESIHPLDTKTQQTHTHTHTHTWAEIGFMDVLMYF